MPITIGPSKTTVTTNYISNNMGTTASCTGYIGDSFPITSMGVCWNTTGTPTTGDTKTTNGISGGVFTANMIGLSGYTLYYVRSYVITSRFGLMYGNQISFTTSNVLAIGNSYQGGIVFYIYNGGVNGYIAKSPATDTVYQWGCYGTAIVGADGTAIGTGNQNTTDIINAACSHVSAAANYCYNLDYSGYTDWWLPSKNELNQMYIQKTVIGGFVASGYWSSSEYSSDYSWEQSFTSGGQVGDGKYLDNYVRAVRGF